jgi:hypothetical protein
MSPARRAKAPLGRWLAVAVIAVLLARAFAASRSASARR